MYLFFLFTRALAVEAQLSISEDGTICYGLLDRSYKGPLFIPEGVKIIWKGAFQWINQLTSLKLPQSLEEIQESAFDSCFGLTGSLTIPDSVTEIGDRAFSDCNSFKGTLTLGKNVKRIGEYAFYGCSGFTGSLTIPDSVTEIGNYAFFGCSGFNGNLTLGKSVKRIGKQAFYCCSGFTGSLTIPDSVTVIGHAAFAVCLDLTEVHFGRQITQIPSSTFEGCSHLKRCFFYNSNVTIQPHAFFRCPDLQYFIEVNECKEFTIDTNAFNGSPMASNFVCLASPQLPQTSLFTEVFVTHNPRLKTLHLAFVLLSL